MLNAKSVNFKIVFDFFEDDNPYEDIFSLYLLRDMSNIPEFISILGTEDINKRVRNIWSLTKREIEYILYNVENILEGVLEETLIELINLRYRRYIFRILYIIWQENYENPKIKRLFLAAIDNPKTLHYLDEIKFSLKNLRELVLAVNTESRMIDFSRQESLYMKEFLDSHNIQLKSILGIDVLSIFFLFCSAQDFMNFGAERLLIAIKRYEMANQAKILNNMAKKLNAQQRLELSPIIKYLLNKYPDPEGKNSGFWIFISPESTEILRNEKI